ncbi:helix-turn-helix transcriptional regulator [Herbiconiux sp.]|uniref:helix-turn-helix transcriptional regulator n=1 Tax=Herbiconiux sp. TaxID=1871186 RepID=UPI0025B7B97C|nr:helix-turn-helix transcriptional regulator [Herbiconiux sp.]
METSTALIGRESELETLLDALGRSGAGSTRVVVVGGEAGIGKTRLVGEFLAGVPADVVVLRGQCVDLDRDAPPYAPLVSALRGLLAAVGADTMLDAAGPARESLAILLPELNEGAAPSVAGVPAGRGGPDQLFDAVATALEVIARDQPLVIVIEDLHWADQATLGLLRFLLRMLEDARILVVLTYRSDEIGRGHALRGWMTELDRNRRSSRLELARLNRKQVRQLTTSITGAPLDKADLDLVVQRTDGVPFFIEEIVGCEVLSAEALPDTLRELLLARYDNLGDAAQRILRLIAAGGARVEHELLADVGDSSPGEIDEAAREAVAARVLVVDDTAYSFRHALVREAVHDELLPGERMRFHTRYAQALEHRGADATAISYHWMAAHNLTAAFTASLAAMAEARASFANATAARMGERALELWEQVPDAEGLASRTRVELLAETSYILRNAGESERAIALIDEAIACSSAAEHPELFARMLRDKASFFANVGYTGSIDLLREALGVLEGHPRSVLRANVLGELAARLMLDALFGEAIDTADAAFDEAQHVESRARMSVAANIRGLSRLNTGDIEGGLADLALAGELAVGNDSARLRFLVNESDALYLLGRFAEAVEVAEAGAERARLLGVERTSGAMLLSNVIAPLAALGHTARADELLDRALDLDPPIGFSAHLQRLKLHSTLRSGDLAAAERMLRGWRSELSRQRRIDAQSRLGLAAVAGEIALAGDHLREAWAEVRIVFAAEHRLFPAYDLPLLATAARVLGCARASGIALDDTSASHPRSADSSHADHASAVDARDKEATDLDVLDRIERRLRAAAAEIAFWPTSTAYLAVIDAELGGPDRTGTDPALWAAAVESCAQFAAPAHLAPYSLFREAEARAVTGDRAEAHRIAHEARRAADAIGFALLTARIDDLERRIGLVKVSGSRSASAGGSAAEPPAVRSVEDELTDRERQVLSLLAQGLSNRQISERLFISVKTASVHVSNILRKTNTTTRTEAAFLARSFGSIGAVDH